MSDQLHVCVIVEGDGEVSSVPLLLRRLKPGWNVLRPIRRTRSLLSEAAGVPAPRDDEVRRLAALAAAVFSEHRAKNRALLLLFDLDDACAAACGPMLRAAFRQHGHSRCEVVFAVREFEAWLLAGLSDYQGQAPESRRDAKGLLRQTLGKAYSPAVDQPRLTSRLDPDLARSRSRSFNHLMTVLDRLDPTTPPDGGTVSRMP